MWVGDGAGLDFGRVVAVGFDCGGWCLACGVWVVGFGVVGLRFACGVLTLWLCLWVVVCMARSVVGCF